MHDLEGGTDSQLALQDTPGLGASQDVLKFVKECQRSRVQGHEAAVGAARGWHLVAPDSMERNEGAFVAHDDDLDLGIGIALEPELSGHPTQRVCSFAVSYTHLRAHETLRYLVCRLLLEKKKKK